MMLDVVTIATLSVVVSATLSGGLLLTAWSLDWRPGLKRWGLGSLVQTLGGMVWVLRDFVPSSLVSPGSQALALWGAALIWSGARVFNGNPRGLGRLWLLVLPAIAVGAWLGWREPRGVLQMMWFCHMSFLFFGAAGWELMFRSHPRLKKSTWVAGFVHFVYGVFHLIRAVAPVDNGASAAYMQAGWMSLLSAATVVVWKVVMTFALFGVVGQRLTLALEEQLRIDPLTKSLTRRALMAEGVGTMKLCSRTKLPCALLLLDLDYFKSVNDRYGHAAGDAALQQFGALIQPALRESDLFARYGGEEFVVLMPGAGETEAWAVAERLRALVASRPVVYQDTSIEITVSIGVAWADAGSDALNLEDLLARADHALYQAKDDGRNKVRRAA